MKSTANGCKLFGFTENELWGKHVDTLFLDLYAESISNYLKHSINEWDSEKSKKTDSFYGKTKSHHSTLINLQLIDPKKIINDKVHFLLLIICAWAHSNSTIYTWFLCCFTCLTNL